MLAYSDFCEKRWPCVGVLDGSSGLEGAQRQALRAFREESQADTIAIPGVEIALVST